MALPFCRPPSLPSSGRFGLANKKGNESIKIFSKAAVAASAAVLFTLVSVAPANALTVTLASDVRCSPKYVKTVSNARYATVHTVGTGGGANQYTIQHGSSYTTKTRYWGLYSAPGPNYVDGVYLSLASISCY